LTRFHLFETRTGEELEVRVDSVRVRRFAPGEVVFHEGDPAESMQLIVRGRFAVRASTPSGHTATLAILGEGSLFGAIELFQHDRHRQTTVVSLESGETLSIAREQFDRMRRERPEAADVLLSIVADDVAIYSEHLMDALFVSAELRVLRRLLEVEAVYKGSEILMTQSELARLAGTSRTTVNKVLRHERSRGTLRLERGRNTNLPPPKTPRRAGSAERTI
jgi:CRP-like cAMP-binding protein